MGQQGVWGAVRVGRGGGVRQQRNNAAAEWHVARPQPGDAEEPLAVLKEKRQISVDFQRTHQ